MLYPFLYMYLNSGFNCHNIAPFIVSGLKCVCLRMVNHYQNSLVIIMSKMIDSLQQMNLNHEYVDVHEILNSHVLTCLSTHFSSYQEVPAFNFIVMSH